MMPNSSNTQSITIQNRHDAFPQVKICGLTQVDEALACAELGAQAIGCVFYPKSPRFITDEQARAICLAVPSHVAGVGVFVNEDFTAIMKKVERCGLRAVQLHGQESPALVRQLLKEGLTVIKAVFVNGTPSLEAASSFETSAFLVECAGGPLPGGNALTWDWEAAAPLALSRPVVLAGGLNPDNVYRAIEQACPDAVDVSSGVESAPGRKDIGKVRRFLESVFQVRCAKKSEKVFP